ncbi:MAG: CDGSH iron-sulfur domain-containing protein [Pseudomonadota bacterium]
MAIEIIKGKDATIHFDAQRCIHSRTCVLSHPDVFVPNVKGEWIHPDAQPAQELIRIGQNCPSGAIQVILNAPVEQDGNLSSSNAYPIVNTLRIRENGPLAIEAELRIKGEPQSVPRATLCRCGLSKNKPYCDVSHVSGEFIASGETATLQCEALAVRDGPVDIQPVPNGPLKIVGNLEIVTGTGRTCNKVTQTFLCRCGQSQNKPYCDGSHKTNGFQAE